MAAPDLIPDFTPSVGRAELDELAAELSIAEGALIRARARAESQPDSLAVRRLLSRQTQAFAGMYAAAAACGLDLDLALAFPARWRNDPAIRVALARPAVA